MKDHKKNLVDLLDYSEVETPGNSSNLVIVGKSVTTFILFTRQAKKVFLHWGDEPGIRGYFNCNEQGCIYCKIEREKIEGILLPVYLPEISNIGFLFIKKDDRPQALLPQIRNFLTSVKEDNPFVLFASKKDGKHIVKARSLSEDMDSGAEAIEAFTNSQPKDDIEIPSVFPVYSNEELAEIPEVAKALQYREDSK